jgi:hypothetical protein
MFEKMNNFPSLIKEGKLWGGLFFKLRNSLNKGGETKTQWLE